MGELGLLDEATGILNQLAADTCVDAFVRLDAAENIAKLGNADGVAVTVLQEIALTDGVDSWVRERAVKAIGDIGSPELARSSLTAVLGESIAEIQMKAAEQLIRLGITDEGIAALRKIARDPTSDPVDRGEAANRAGRTRANR